MSVSDPNQRVKELEERLNTSQIRLEKMIEQLKESKDLYQMLFDNLADEVHLWKVIRNEHGEIRTWELVDANPSALKSWGRTKEEVVGKTTNEIFGYDAVSQFRPMISDLIESGEAQKWESYFEPTDQFLSMSTVPFGEYFLSTGEDVTEKKKAEKALKTSEQRYRMIANNLPGVLLQYQRFLDGTDRLLYMSKGITELYEVPLNQALEDNSLLWERVHPDDLPEYLNSIEESASKLSRWSYEHRLLFPDGRIKWVSMRGTPVLQPDGSIIWDSIGLDITKQKEAEKELELLNANLEKRVKKRTKKILKVSKQLEDYRTAAEQSESGVWYLNIKRDELSWDDIMYRLYEVDKADFSGAYEAWETSLHPQDKQRAVDDLNSAIEGIKPFDTIFRIVPARTKKVRYIRAKGKVERNKNGEAIGILGTNWDVTKEMEIAKERERVIRKLKETQAQLIQSEKMATLGMLTAGIAHEINNPLNYISGGYTVIRDILEKKETVSKDEVLEYLDWIKVGTDRATDIVRSLNLFSRNNEDNNEQCDLEKIIEDSLSVLQHKHKDRITVRKSLEGNNVVVEGNNGRLNQALLNILSNAIDSIDNKGEIQIRLVDKDNEVVVQVTDNGHGMDADTLKRITDPFFTTKLPGKGTGLGMSITRTIIDEHQGELQFESEVNRGTKVRVVLPRNQ